MHIISYKKIREFIKKHPNSKSPLNEWYHHVNSTGFYTFQEVRNMFSSADLVKNFVVFNIGGNNFRLIAYLNYDAQRLFIRHILTHAEYDKEEWKKDEWFTIN